MGLKLAEITKPMLVAASNVVGERWPEIKTYAETEAKKVAHTLIMIEKLKVQGKMSEEQARVMLNMQSHASRVVLLTIQGITLLAAEAAINAAFEAAAVVVNKAIGWKLI